MSEVIHFNSNPLKWHGDLTLCHDKTINKSYRSLEDIGWELENYAPHYWGPINPEYYQASTLFVRKHNGKMEYGHYGDSRATETSLLFNDVDAEFNFKDFDWIQIFLADAGPTIRMLENIKIPVFTTAYYNFEFKNYEPDLGVPNPERYMPDVKKLTLPYHYNRGLLVNNTLSVLPTCAYNNFFGVNFKNLIKFKKEYAKHHRGLQQKVGWRGSMNCHQRYLLVKLSHDNFDMIDAKQWVGIPNYCPPANKDFSNQFIYNEYMTLEDQITQFDYLIEVGAGGFSGRVPHLIQSNRIVLSTDHPVWSYAEHQLVSDIHYVRIKKDLSNLVEKLQDMKNNPLKYEVIRDNMYNLSETHFTLENIRKIVYETMCIRLNL